MKKIRESNFELLRIISMFAIVIYHVITYIGKTPNQGVLIILDGIKFLLVIHVNLFVLITGFFQSTSNIKQSKIWSILNSCFFYKIAIILLLSYLEIINLTKTEIINELNYLNIYSYWFIKVYLYLYLLSPYLNKFIESLTKKTYQKSLLLFFVIFSIIPIITNNQLYLNDGYTLVNFIFLYMIGAYLKKYPISKNYIFQNISINLIRILMISIYLICAVFNFTVTYTSAYLVGTNTILKEICETLYNFRWLYSNPIIIVQSISVFILFSTIKFKSKFVNNMSKLTLGIYIIHENNYFRGILYKITNISTSSADSYSYILYVIFISIIIYIVCSIIEFIRQVIFLYFYKRKISTKIRNQYYNFLKTININNKN